MKFKNILKPLAKIIYRMRKKTFLSEFQRITFLILKILTHLNTPYMIAPANSFPASPMLTKAPIL